MTAEEHTEPETEGQQSNMAWSYRILIDSGTTAYSAYCSLAEWWLASWAWIVHCSSQYRWTVVANLGRSGYPIRTNCHG